MRTVPRGTLVVAFYGLLAGMVVCFALAMRFQVRKHEASGIPFNHYVRSENDRLYHVPRLADPAGQRPEVPISDEQYRQWERNEGWSTVWGGLSILCVVTAVAVGVVTDRLAGVGRKVTGQTRRGT